MSVRDEEALKAAYKFFNSSESFGGPTIAAVARQIIDGINVAAEMGRSGKYDYRADLINEAAEGISIDDIDANARVLVADCVSYYLTNDPRDIRATLALCLSQYCRVSSWFADILPGSSCFEIDRDGAIFKAYEKTEGYAYMRAWLASRGGQFFGLKVEHGLTLDLAIKLQQDSKRRKRNEKIN